MRTIVWQGLSRLVMALVLSHGLESRAAVSAVDPTDRLLSNTRDGADWAAYGRTFDENHFSPLTQISTSTIGELGLAWSFDLPPSVSAAGAPVAVNGVLYVATGLSVVRAIEAASGRLLWTYDPDVAAVAGDALRPAWGIRGLAYGYGKLFVGTQDGRLIALSTETGRPDWIVQTTTPGDGRYITGAPRVFADKVMIGNAGSDFKPTRGYVTTYDCRTGKRLWRFFIVPGDPRRGFENDAMRTAAKTWTGEWWKFGGGGGAWNSLAYDPQFNRVYIGTGNGYPWNQSIRSPGGGDNLFLSSIVALDANSGRYAWHYQTTPGDNWDYDAATDIELATLSVQGKETRVLLHAGKNGFFYVIDRRNGQLISADAFTPETWALRTDERTGRPVENPGARFKSGGALVRPSSGGGHSWQAMAFSPVAGLVYIPTIDLPEFFQSGSDDPTAWQPTPGMVRNSGYDLVTHFAGGALTGPPGSLQAWNPLRRKAEWSVPLNTPISGGVLATGGRLVFQGRTDGHFVALDDASGRELWSFDAQVGIVAQPISFLANGKQYVTVVAGFGGGGAGYGGLVSRFGWNYRTQHRRVLTFALGGTAALPVAAPALAAVPIAYPELQTDTAAADRGAQVYAQNCQYCHGTGAVSGGSAPDLRASAVTASPEALAAIVRGGSLERMGMPKFADLSDGDLRAVSQYVMARSHADAAAVH